MARELPYWLQVLQALSTPAIALLAAVIGVMQWRTAHQRAVLDLFQKRWDAYSEMRHIIGDVMREGHAPTETSLAFFRAANQAKFIFGTEVNAYLQSVYTMLVDLHHAQERMKGGGLILGKWADKEAKLSTEIGEFFEKFELLAMPYMRMHQKVPWSWRAIKERFSALGMVRRLRRSVLLNTW